MAGSYKLLASTWQAWVRQEICTPAGTKRGLLKKLENAFDLDALPADNTLRQEGFMITEIKFECSKCGQRMLVDSEAAGMMTPCPSCGTSITVPKQAASSDRAYAPPKRPRDAHRPQRDAKPRESKPVRVQREEFSDAETAELREELVNASVETTRLEGELNELREQLATAKAEAARLRQQQQESGGAEVEKLDAAATHAQAEIKSFQNERLALKNEFSLLRQKLGAAEARLNEQAAQLAENDARIAQHETEAEQVRRSLNSFRKEAEKLRTNLATSEAAVEQARTDALRLVSDLEKSCGEIQNLQLQVSERDFEINYLKEQLTGTQAARTAGLREIQALTEERDGLTLELTEARAGLAAAEQLGVRFRDTEQALATTREQLKTAEENCRSLTAVVEDLKKEAHVLRESVSENAAGKELLATRERLAQTEKERDRMAGEARQLREDLQKVETTAKSLDEQLKTVRRQFEEAQRAAEEQSQARLRQDNEVLRGIIARQNSDLEQKHVQLARLKRARLALRLIYAIFALLLIGVGVLAVNYVPALRF